VEKFWQLKNQLLGEILAPMTFHPSKIWMEPGTMQYFFDNLFSSLNKRRLADSIKE
jgi:hypothetical protein